MSLTIQSKNAGGGYIYQKTRDTSDGNVYLIEDKEYVSTLNFKMDGANQVQSTRKEPLPHWWPFIYSYQLQLIISHWFSDKECRYLLRTVNQNTCKTAIASRDIVKVPLSLKRRLLNWSRVELWINTSGQVSLDLSVGFGLENEKVPLGLNSTSFKITEVMTFANHMRFESRVRTTLWACSVIVSVIETSICNDTRFWAHGEPTVRWGIKYKFGENSINSNESKTAHYDKPPSKQMIGYELPISQQRMITEA